MLLLPAAAFGLVTLFDLDPLLAVGMMLLAASPGGTTANLFSHLFRGDVALNVTLTAVNSVIAVVTLPLITNFALGGYFEPEDADGTLGLQFTKVLQVFAVVLIPVALGMWVRLRSSAFAERMDKPVRIGSAVVLALVIVGTVVSERENIADYLVDIGVVAALFCLLSLSIGYVVPPDIRHRGSSGHRQFHGNRHPQQHVGDHHRRQSPRQRAIGSTGRGVRRSDVPARCSLRRRHHPKVTDHGRNRLISGGFRYR